MPARLPIKTPFALTAVPVPLPPPPLAARLPAGITFQYLFQCCRERFLVSNESLLKSFLTEFRDHELLQTK